MMSCMVLRLDPRYPLVWRDPVSLQIGAETPVVTLQNVSPSVERLIGALMAGISRVELESLATRLGVAADEIPGFLDSIGPALATEPSRPRHTSWIIDGQGLTAQRVAALLTAAGLANVDADTDLDADAHSEAKTDLAIIVASHVIDPRRYIRWLSRDIPHLAVVYTDTGARVGPLVEPGTGPCLHCLAIDAADRDPSWPAIASQLLGQAASSEREPLVSIVAGLAARVAQSRLVDGVNDLASATLSFDAHSLTGRRVWHRQHPECGCRSLSGSESVPSAASHALAVRPTT